MKGWIIAAIVQSWVIIMEQSSTVSSLSNSRPSVLKQVGKAGAAKRITITGPHEPLMCLGQVQQRNTHITPISDVHV